MAHKETELFYIPGSMAIAWHQWLDEQHPEVLKVNVKQPEQTEVKMWFSEFLHAQRQKNSQA